jgi:hypothetical protein
MSGRVARRPLDGQRDAQRDQIESREGCTMKGHSAGEREGPELDGTEMRIEVLGRWHPNKKKKTLKRKI